MKTISFVLTDKDPLNTTDAADCKVLGHLSTCGEFRYNQEAKLHSEEELDKALEAIIRGNLIGLYFTENRLNALRITKDTPVWLSTYCTFGGKAISSALVVYTDNATIIHEVSSKPAVDKQHVLSDGWGLNESMVYFQLAMPTNVWTLEQRRFSNAPWDPSRIVASWSKSKQWRKIAEHAIATAKTQFPELQVGDAVLNVCEYSPTGERRIIHTYGLDTQFIDFEVGIPSTVVAEQELVVQPTTPTESVYGIPHANTLSNRTGVEIHHSEALAAISTALKDESLYRRTPDGKITVGVMLFGHVTSVLEEALTTYLATYGWCVTLHQVGHHTVISVIEE